LIQLTTGQNKRGTRTPTTQREPQEAQVMKPLLFVFIFLPSFIEDFPQWLQGSRKSARLS